VIWTHLLPASNARWDEATRELSGKP
jgi:hypothetical protein